MYNYDNNNIIEYVAVMMSQSKAPALCYLNRYIIMYMYVVGLFFFLSLVKQPPVIPFFTTENTLHSVFTYTVVHVHVGLSTCKLFTVLHVHVMIRYFYINNNI